MTKTVFRVLDANLNRAREGLRGCEEVARMILDDPRLTRRCQQARYDLGKAAQQLSRAELLRARDSRADVGRPERRGKLAPHRGYRDLAASNAKRAQEAIRVLEEFTRLKAPQVSRKFGSLRFRLYSVEQDLLRKLSAVRHR